MLDKMASGLMERKEAAAARAKLTPVKGERAKAPTVVAGMPVIAATFPNDQPGEVVEGIIRDLERTQGQLSSVIEALRAAIGQAVEPATVIDLDEKRKAAEFAADFAAKQREAQASAFTAPDSTVEGGEDPEPAIETLKAAVVAETEPAPSDVAAAEAGLWVCPEHGTRQETKSRKGRDMIACGSYPKACQKFELPA